MSMREYATTGRGLLIPKHLAGFVVKNYAKHHGERDDDYDSFEDEDFDGTLSDIHSIGGKNVDSFYDCSGDFFDIDEKDYVFFDKSEVDETSFHIISIDKYPSLFTRAYKDIDEIVNEFKNSVGKYFPEDFDYKKYLVCFIGTYLG